jgi:hypothetical protein
VVHDKAATDVIQAPKHQAESGATHSATLNDGHQADPIQTRGKLFGIDQTCINPNLAAC